MAPKKEHSPQVKKNKRKKNLLAAFGIVAASFLGYEAYDGLYIPHQAQQAYENQDAEAFFELLPDLTPTWQTERIASRMLEQMFTDGTPITDDMFRNMVDSSPGSEFSAKLLGIAVLSNNQNQIQYYKDHAPYQGYIDIDFPTMGSTYDLETIQNIHAETPYSPANALYILRAAVIDGEEEIENWLKANFDYSDTRLLEFALNRHNFQPAEMLSGIELSPEQQHTLLINARHERTGMVYAFENYEYSEDQLRELFNAFITGGGTVHNMNLLLEHFTPTEEEIQDAFERTFDAERGITSNSFTLLSEVFPIPAEINQQLFENAVEHNNERAVLAYIGDMPQDIIEEQYIEAASRNHDETLFAIDIANVTLPQDTINDAFITAAIQERRDALRHIAGTHSISPETAREALTQIISLERRYDSSEFARELRDIINDFEERQAIITRPSSPAINAPSP